ncbi:hypothetical protein LX64_01333 [Chitinophaga skermanii]|uniref:Uncharacterized protein n=1 Tax=Chitinophaga skermanii TaxID=331697 RepID=A0A327QVQ1_9BACT|nr:hypothetical protein [Chitinophaga skermanii]RAJ08679.1 hypothetical protein LX64_01333 [Chitinophaga skermanii]
MTVRFRLLILVFVLILGALNANGQNCTINAGVATSVCPNQPFTLAGTSSGLVAEAPVWSQVGGPTVTITSPTSLNTAVTGYSPGNTYRFRLSSKCVDGSLIFDEVVYTTHRLTTANAGPDMIVCPSAATVFGNAVAAGETGTWTTVSGNSVSFTSGNRNKNELPITVSTTNAGNTTLRWTITSSSNSCVSTDDVVISNGAGVSPVTAGPNQSLSNCYTSTQSATLAGSYAGTGVNGQIGTWTMVSGPNKATIANKNQNNTGISNLIEGTYVFRWTVTGNCVNGSAEVTITVPAGTQSVTNVGASTLTYCDGRTSTVLTGVSPSYTNEVVTWTRTSGVGTISSPNSPSTEVTGLNGSTSVFTYRIQNSVTGCASSNTVTINYTTPPTVTASSPIIAACDVTNVSVPFTFTGGNQRQWSLISGPAGSTLGGSTGTTAYTNATSPIAVNGLTVPGTYVVRIRNTTNNGNGGCSDAFADVYIEVSKTPTASNAGTRQVLACNVYETHLAGNVPVNGKGTWSQVAGPNTAVMADKADPTTLISGLTNGVYTFRWIISGNVGCPNQQSDVQVVVANTTPTAAAAGENVTICNGTPYILTGNTPVLNETGTWSVSPTGPTFSSVNDPRAVVNGMTANREYTFTWNIRNACAQNNATVKVTTSNTAGPKQAVAGPDQCLARNSVTFTLAGNQPTNGEAGTWTKVSGPTGTITNPSLYNTTVTAVQPGTYVFEWVLSRNLCIPTRDTVLVTVSDATSKSVAGTNQTLCGQTVINLSGNVPTVGVGTWSQVEGPGGIIITNPSSNTTTVTNVTDGRYAFRWTITNGACPTETSDVKIEFATPPTQANAGTNFEVCDVTTSNLNANTITNGTGTWSVVSGPSTPTITGINNPQAAIGALKYGTYVFRWTAVGSPNCPPSTSTVTVTVNQSADIPAGNQNLCNVNTTTLTGNESSTGTWTQTSGPSSTITRTANNAAVVTGMTPGTYVFRYTIPATANCATSYKEITVVNSAPASVADAGPDQALCLATAATTRSATMAAITPTVGTGTWTTDVRPSGSTAPTFTASTSPTTNINGLVVGTYIFKWTVRNGNCSVTGDVVRVVVTKEPSNADAGVDQVNGCTQKIFMAGVEPAVGIGTWSLVSGPNTPTFDMPNSATTQVLNTVPGTYVFRWTVSNGAGCAVKTDDVQVVVTSLPATTANGNVAGSNLNLCNTGSGAALNLIGSNPNATETGEWAWVDNPSNAIITSPTTPFTSMLGLNEGVHRVRWTITNGSCTSSDTLTVRVWDQPTTATTAGTVQACLYAPVVLNGNNPTKGTGTWSFVSGPSTTTTFSNPNQHNANLNGAQAGTYQYMWTISNGVCPASTAYTTVEVEDCRIAVAKSASTPIQNADGSYNVTFTFNVSNPGSKIEVNDVQVTDDLTGVFKDAKSFAVQSVTATGPLSTSVNAAFDGRTNVNLLSSGATLAASASATITVIVKVNLN